MTNVTALVAMNLQNQFTDPKGALYYSFTGDTMPRILEGISLLRERGVHIIYAMAEMTGAEFTYDTELLKRRDPIPMQGSWAAELDGRIDSIEGDYVIQHYASSAFFGTTLAKLLKDRGVKNVIICGVKTNYDVRATATDAMWNDFRAYVAEDMTACDSPELNAMHLEELTKYTAKALSLKEILNRIENGDM